MSKAFQKRFIVDLKSGVISPDPTTSDVAIIQREQFAKQLFFTILDPEKALGQPTGSSANDAPAITCRLAYKNINKYNPDEYVSNAVDCVSGVNNNCFCASRSLTQEMTQFPGKLLICLQILDADPKTDKDPDAERYFRTQPLSLTVLPSRELTIDEFNAGSTPEITDEFKSELDALFNSIAITTDKIQDDAVTSDKIGNGEVKENNIANGAVTNTKIANYTIQGVKIAPTTITAANLANDSITAAKIASSSTLYNAPLTYYIRRDGLNAGFNATDQQQQGMTTKPSNGVITSIDELITQYYKKGLSIKAAIGINDDGSEFFWGDLLQIRDGDDKRCVFGGRYHLKYYQLEFIDGESNLKVDKFTVFSPTFQLRASDGGALGIRSDGDTYHPSIPFDTLWQHYLQNDLIRASIAVGTGAIWGELSWLSASAGVFTAIYKATEYRLSIERNPEDDSIKIAEYKATPLPQKWKYSTATLFWNDDSLALQLDANYIASIDLLIPKGDTLGIYKSVDDSPIRFEATTDNTVLLCQFIPLNNNMWFYHIYINDSLSTGTFPHTDTVYFTIDNEDGVGDSNSITVINTELKLKG